MAKPIPSAAEIAEIIARKAIGLPTSNLAATDYKVDKLEGKIADLENKVARRRRTAKELSEEMFLLMEKHEFSPAEELIGIAIQLRDKPEMLTTRIHILEELLGYTVPKLKSVEVNATVDHQVHVSITRWGDDGTITKERIGDPGSVKQVVARVKDFVEVEGKVVASE
jgi:hypothetical protein